MDELKVISIVIGMISFAGVIYKIVSKVSAPIQELNITLTKTNARLDKIMENDRNQDILIKELNATTINHDKTLSNHEYRIKQIEATDFIKSRI